MCRLAVILLLLGSSLSCTGCALWDAGKDVTKAGADQFKFRDRDYRDDANLDDNYNDEWGGVGKEGRGHEPMEHESDGLSKWWASPKARAIERNLGFD